MTAEELERYLQARGCASRMAGISRLADLRDDFSARVRGGELDPAVVRERLGFFDFRPPESLPEAISIIVVAIPLPRARLFFHWHGKLVPVAVPPAYIRFDDAGRSMQRILTEALSASGHRVAPALLPEKLLAARCGLAAYGRNNITYVDGMGSFLRLATFFTDLPCGTERWQEPAMLARCAGCHSCARACPTTAIAPDRFLLHTERCVVFHNERPGSIPFPDWIEPSSHACLVGCLECQRACPENVRFLNKVVEEGEFTDEETILIADGVPLDRLPASLVEKLKCSDLLCLFAILSRNLRAVLSNPAAANPGKLDFVCRKD
jgi:epoxyqueuosine reductase